MRSGLPQGVHRLVPDANLILAQLDPTSAQLGGVLLSNRRVVANSGDRVLGPATGIGEVRSLLPQLDSVAYAGMAIAELVGHVRWHHPAEGRGLSGFLCVGR